MRSEITLAIHYLVFGVMIDSHMKSLAQYLVDVKKIAKNLLNREQNRERHYLSHSKNPLVA